MLTPTEALAPGGPLAQRLQGFAPRAQQQEMAECVARALEDHQVLITEAGTGTGKTFAYLTPALLSGKKVIISTGTKNLQDQLFHRDLPLVRDALGVPVSIALLKGRANYLCLHRLELAESEGRFTNRQQMYELLKVRGWAGRTQTGDKAELTDVTEDALIWPQVTSTADNCLGQDCPSFKECFVLKARRAAQEADVLVINHHLLFADMALRDGGFGELLPGANALILDEAHQLPETASSFFGMSVSSRQLLELAQDTADEQVREASDMPALRDAAEHLETAARDMRLAMGHDNRRGAWRELGCDARVSDALRKVQERLMALHQMLDASAARGKGLENCSKRAAELLEQLAAVVAMATDQHIHWFETFTRTFTLHRTPLDIADTFRTHLQAFKCAWIFTSATLTVNGSFAHFATRMGLEDALERRWDSPFDFSRLALFYVPKDMPEPADSAYTRAVITAALPVLQASGGRAFLLFTSHRALQEAADLLTGEIDFPLLVQGSLPRRALLEKFRVLGNAVLLGTSSFWEGVDVRGAALSCVIIDKLPFASPGDPVLQARLEAMRELGKNPFIEFQLPHAIIMLKQGVGRLIRDTNDRGVLMICDPRLLTKSYGRSFIDSLPPMARTRKLEDVQRFFACEPLSNVTDSP